jgi:NAD(P)-dependent dehydrogenase (short-subunit alcohol dehydrogenase family)
MRVLDGKVAIVAGGTSGIGAEIVETFAAAGASVLVGGRRADRGEAIVARLGPATQFMRTDVSVESDVAALIDAAVSRFGRLDIMVNTAGEPGPGGSITTFDLDRFQQTVAVHVGGVLAGMKHAARHMKSRRAGSIINMASTTGRLAGWSGIGYSAAKAAVIQATRAVAVELGEFSVRVNSISPGPILTGIFAKGAGMAADAADQSAAALAPAFAEALEQWQSVRRAGRPADVAAAALWLAGDTSEFVTGIDLVVDGGISAGRPASVAIAERSALAAVFAALPLPKT